MTLVILMLSVIVGSVVGAFAPKDPQWVWYALLLLPMLVGFTASFAWRQWRRADALKAARNEKKKMLDATSEELRKSREQMERLTKQMEDLQLACCIFPHRFVDFVAENPERALGVLQLLDDLGAHTQPLRLAVKREYGAMQQEIAMADDAALEASQMAREAAGQQAMARRRQRHLSESGILAMLEREAAQPDLQEPEDDPAPPDPFEGAAKGFLLSM